ncbi:hypothetical protein BDAG_02014 [Burkholderia dolosa AU0158]|nr:hypothetical protein BDAG_02014 [Burkholderia dolosa AU0158]
MALPLDNVSMAVFCDFENVALGVRDAKYEKFDIKPVLERLLLKGSIVVKKAYCDWDRYKGFKAAMHEASFELIEIPHVRQSGKNSADIRLVVDALDLLLYEVARRHVRDHQRRLRFLAARVEAAREREEGDRRRREEIDVGPAGRELRRIHLLRRSGARAAARAREARTAARGQRRREAARRAVAQARHGRTQGRGDRARGRDVRCARVGA